MGPRRVITIFGSACPQPDDADYETARRLGRLLGEAGFALCNGGYGGTMEAAARGVRDSLHGAAPGNAIAIGVTCDAFLSRRVNPWIDREVTAATLFERITRLLELGDAYVVLPGGTGTLLELAAAWEYIHKGFLSERPIVLLGEHWRGVLDAVRHDQASPASPDPLRSVYVRSTPDDCVKLLVELLGRQG